MDKRRKIGKANERKGKVKNGQGERGKRGGCPGPIRSGALNDKSHKCKDINLH